MIEQILNKLKGIGRTGAGYEAMCPSHKDRQPSLSINPGKKGWMMYCHRGCSTKTIMVDLELPFSMLFYDYNPNHSGYAPAIDQRFSEHMRESTPWSPCWKLHRFDDVTWAGIHTAPSELVGVEGLHVLNQLIDTLTRWLGGPPEFEVLDTVIRLVSVDVMDVLSEGEGATKVVLHHNTVFTFTRTVGLSNHGVSPGVNVTIRSKLAKPFGTEMEMLFTTYSGIATLSGWWRRVTTDVARSNHAYIISTRGFALANAEWHPYTSDPFEQTMKMWTNLSDGWLFIWLGKWYSATTGMDWKETKEWANHQIWKAWIDQGCSTCPSEASRNPVLG